ncbi:Tuberculostearic acid methyltransferase UfaA1 [bacterium HR39]|nr:Tuberculostearic acid methyltransferase UfaA1 [bacterium HR39]
MLPTRTILAREARAAGLVPDGERRFGADYARTLETWLARFDAAEQALATLGFHTPFRRLWRLYLVYCAVGFRDGRIDVGQYRFVRPAT